jgi:hypothetical protein
MIENGGSYNALEVLQELHDSLFTRRYWFKKCAKYEAQRRRALLWLVAERKRRRELQEFVRELNNT